MPIVYSAYAKHESGSSMMSCDFATVDEAADDLAHYALMVVEQGLTPLSETAIRSGCSSCGGHDGEHFKVLNARKHAHRYHPDSCYKQCPER